MKITVLEKEMSGSGAWDSSLVARTPSATISTNRTNLRSGPPWLAYMVTLEMGQTSGETLEQLSRC
jgi:hypothetical protein